MILLLAGCGKETAKVEPIPANKPVASKIEKNPDDKILVVYFSRPETDNPKNISTEKQKSCVVVNGEVFGNTQYVAMHIQKYTAADIFRIEPVTPYPMNHATLEQIATKEKQENILPEIRDKIENFDSYKIFFVGYPIWYGDMPQILYSFLQSYDFTGKTIVPFVTSGSSGFSNTINSIKTLLPNATVIEDGLSVKRNGVLNSEPVVKDWLTALGF